MKIKKNGFTLIELMVVIALIGILAGIATPRILEEIPKIELKNAAYNLAGDLRLARSNAVKNQTDVRIDFSNTAAVDSYKITSSGNDGVFNAGAVDPVIKTVDLSNYRGGIKFGKGAAPKQANTDGSNFTGESDFITFPNERVTFAKNGLISGFGGYVYLSNQNDITCYAVGITSMAGIVIIKRNSGGVWVTL